MDRTQLLRAYDAEVRAKPIARPGFKVDDEDGIVRLVGPFVFVSWWRLEEDTIDLAMARLVARGRATGKPLIWRVFEHDQPPTLAASLRRHGFVAELPGTLMVFDLQESLPGVFGPAELRRAATPQEVDDHLAVMDAVFDDGDAARLKATYDALLDDRTFCLFTAYVGGEPVAGARLESGPGREFGALFGGGVQPSHRGKGIYRSLVQARADEARRLGLRYLSTEALETSRPILERMGFVALARETTWTLPTP